MGIDLSCGKTYNNVQNQRFVTIDLDVNLR